jgi:hypothetical protein
MGGSDVEQWGFYNAFNFHFPSEAELEQMHAIIIPGSSSAAYDVESTPWIPVLTRLI